jgi:hypothetical protein
MMHLKKIRATGCAVLAVVLVLSGCVQENRVNTLLQSEADSSQAEEPVAGGGSEEQSSGSEETVSEEQKAVTDNGRIFWDNVYQESGITLKQDGRIYEASWDNPSAEIICTDPSCIHRAYNETTNPDPTCGAAVSGNYSSTFALNSFLYKGQRVVLYSYTERVEELEINYYTEVYVCDLDGENRKKVADLDGVIYSFDGLIQDGYLYCTIQKKVTQYPSEEVRDGQTLSVLRNQVDAYLCSINLDTWEEITLEPKVQNGTDMPYWMCFYYTDGGVYCVGGDENLYRIDTETQTGESLPDLEQIEGAGNGYLFYADSSDRSRILKRDVQTGEETLFVDYTEDQWNGFKVLQNFVLTCSSVGEGDNIFFTYKMYDFDGNVIGTYTDTEGYMSTITQVGDYIYYEKVDGVYCIKADEFENCREASVKIDISQ